MQRIALLAAAVAFTSLVGCCCHKGCGGGGYGACYQPAPQCSPCGPCGASYSPSPAPTYLGAPSGGCPSGNCGVYPSGAYIPAGGPTVAMAPGVQTTAMMPGAYQTASVAMDPMPTY